MPDSLMKQAKAKQPTVFRDMDILSEKHGPEVFRIVGQRYFKTQNQRAALKREIAEAEKALRELQQKAAR